MPAFTHLHVHSCFSLLSGSILPERLAEIAAAHGMNAIALTDQTNLGGAVQFVRACKRTGVRPILGLEVPVMLPENIETQTLTVKSGPLTLLAMDQRGWANLCALTASLLDNPQHDSSTACSLDMLAAHSDGLVLLTGGRRALLNRLAAAGNITAAEQWLCAIRDLFTERIYLEVQAHLPEDAALLPTLTNLGTQCGVPLAASHDIFYELPGDENTHRTLTAIRLNRTLGQLVPDDLTPRGYFLSSEAITTAFADLPAALENTQVIAERCQFDLPIGVRHFPQIPLPAGTTPDDLLRDKAFSGARRLYGELSPEIETKLSYELEVIRSLGFEPIFLIMEEVLRFARSAGVPVSSRGSAASSLVAHCLGITAPDPIRLNLYFERFLNPARVTPPDIDTDLCSRRRDLVIQHVVDTYGHDRVAMVGTVNRFRPRSALGEAAKAYGLPAEEIRRLTAQLPYYYFHGDESPDDSEEEAPVSPFRSLEENDPGGKYRHIIRSAESLLGLPRHFSVHPGGVVITPTRLTDLLPVQRATKGIRITQFDHKDLEPLGVVKLDLLGIRGLTVLGDVAAAVHSWQQRDFDNPLDVLSQIPLYDPEVSAMVKNGQTIGCFQIESPGMRATLREVNASSIDDIIVALALYRPGPLTGGLKDAFVRRHNGQEAVEHIHPALAPLLNDTYGVILYQEQVLRIAHELAGLSLAESDLLRRAMSHFDPGRQMQLLREKFIRGAEGKSGVDADSAARIWELMAAFAGYGFPKAHAASYAQVAWQSAWCKTHFPAEFMAAVLANWGGYYSQRVYLTESRRMGLNVRPPHINHSQREFSTIYPMSGPVLYMGLNQVRGLTGKTIERILRRRPFRTLTDFLARVNPRREEVRSLVICGAFEGFGSIPKLLDQLDQGAQTNGQLSLFDFSGEKDLPDWPLEAQMRAQQEILGISVGTHPLELFQSQIKAAGAVSTLEAAARPGQRLTVAGVRQGSRRSRDTKGRMMLFLSLEDLEGMLDVICFADVYSRFRAELSENQPVLIEGIMSQDEPVLVAQRVHRIK